MIFCLPVYQRASLMAFSLASAPPFVKKDALRFPGVTSASSRASSERYAKDLLADRATRFVDRAFPLWVLLGMAFPFGLGVALTGTLVGGLTGLLWGGAVRVLFLHHATFSINSLCHFFGRRRFATGDESRNLLWLALTLLPPQPLPVLLGMEALIWLIEAFCLQVYPDNEVSWPQALLLSLVMNLTSFGIGWFWPF